jgi:hypothetical protein
LMIHPKDPGYGSNNVSHASRTNGEGELISSSSVGSNTVKEGQQLGRGSV